MENVEKMVFVFFPFILMVLVSIVIPIKTLFYKSRKYSENHENILARVWRYLWEDGKLPIIIGIITLPIMFVVDPLVLAPLNPPIISLIFPATPPFYGVILMWGLGICAIMGFGVEVSYQDQRKQECDQDKCLRDKKEIEDMNTFIDDECKKWLAKGPSDQKVHDIHELQQQRKRSIWE